MSGMNDDDNKICILFIKYELIICRYYVVNLNPGLGEVEYMVQFIGETNGIILILNDTSSFTSNTLLIRNSIMLQFI